VHIEFLKHSPIKGACILFIESASNMGPFLRSLDKDGYITKSIKHSPAFEGKEGQTIHILSPQCCSAERLFIISLGNKEEIDKLSMQRIGAKITDLLNQNKISTADIIAEDLGDIISLDKAEAIANLLFGARIKNYAFNNHFEKKKDQHALYLKSLSITCADSDAIINAGKELTAAAEGIILTRNLVSEPANILHPEEFMQRCKALTELGVKLTVLDKAKMASLGMNALLGVAQGSAMQPYTVIMEWKPNNLRTDKTLALVGKGVCFDSGGINIKPTAGMGDMKYDKAGAATVVGAMHTIATRKANAHVIGIIGLVENMPSGTAQRPSDIITTMSGQTVEVGNTDAEGRLVLADIMHYVQKNYKITHMIDIATLTGAVVVALGETYAGAFSNTKNLAEQLCTIGEETGDLLWHMPLHKNYDKQIDSIVADISNDGGGRGAGSCTAAHFLQRFVLDGCIWAHLDIAGMAWNKNGTALSPAGATGFGVKVFDRFVKKHIEQ